MAYKLISNGQLLEGANEAIALKAIAKVARLSEAKARKIFLSGRRIKVSSSAERIMLDKISNYLRKAGVDVEVIEVPEASDKPVEATVEKTAAVAATDMAESVDCDKPENSESDKKITKQLPRMLAAVFAVMFVMVIGVAGYGWYWLYLTPSQALMQAENALADGNLVAVGYVDVEKVVVINDHILGETDPGALPVSETKRDLIKQLFTGPANFRDNLTQFIFSVHVSPDKQGVSGSMLLAGKFEAQTILNELQRSFEVIPQGEGGWQLTEKIVAEPDDAPLCEKDEKVTSKPSVLTLNISESWLMISSDPLYAVNLWQRVVSDVDANQDLIQWRDYREGQIAALMAFMPEQAAKVVTGMPGMMARGVAQKVPEMKAIGSAAAVDIVSAGLNLNFSLFSDNPQWNSQTISKARTTLDEMQADSLSVSPTMASLFSRVTTTDSDEYIAVDIALDAEILSDIENIIEEGIASLFTPTISNGRDEKTQQDEIKEHLINYDLYAGLKQLPSIDLESFKHQSPPQFIDGAYAVSLNSIDYQEEDYFKLNLGAKIGFPKGREFMADSVETMTFSIDSIQSKSGEELMRDERCAKPDNVYGPANHEPQTSFSAFNDLASLSKNLRLKKGVYPEAIDKIRGNITFSAPTAVSKFTVALKAGEVVEHAGVRFYLSSIKGGAVNYHLSGDYQRLLEVRALNKDGRALKSNWSMGGNSEGRSSKSFKGKVASIEVYIADQLLAQEKSFLLTDLFSTPEKEKRVAPVYLAPNKVSISRWNKYSKHKMANLKTDPKDWHVWGKNKQPIAEASWSTARMFVTHTPQNWGNTPTAHLYFPMLMELPGVLSALSHTISIPAHKDGVMEKYTQVSYPYRSDSGKISIKHRLKGLPVAYRGISLRSGLADNEKVDHLEGEFVFRLPTKTVSHKFPLNGLWPGVEVSGMTVTVTSIALGMFTGYNLKVEGDIEKLVNLHGIGADGKRVVADPINFQDGGYWTMILPLNKGIESVELVSATKQKVIRLPFDLRANYGAQ